MSLLGSCFIHRVNIHTEFEEEEKERLDKLHSE